MGKYHKKIVCFGLCTILRQQHLTLCVGRNIVAAEAQLVTCRYV